MADTWKTSRVGLRNQNATTKESAELDKEAEALARKIIENAFKKDAPVSEDFGKQIAGFLSKAASVKLKGINAKQDPTPALSGGSAGKGNTQTPANKAALDAMTGTSSASSNVIKKVVASGSLEGVKQAGKDGFNLSDKQITEVINQATADAEAAANDPATQEKFRKIGIDPAFIVSATKNMTANASKLTFEDQIKTVTSNQKKISTKQMQALDNPFGSFQAKIAVPDLGVKAGDPLAPGSDLLKKMQAKTGLNAGALSSANPFGSMGVDFGNIQGAMSALANGLGAPKDLGVNVPTVAGVNNISAAGFASAAEVPDIVNKGGFTNLNTVVEKSESIPDNIQPSTPVEEIGVPTDRPLQAFLYTTAHTAEEIELELGSTTRNIKAFITRWTATTTDKRIKSVKEFNESKIAKNKETYGASTTGEDESIYSYPAHYIILRDGTIQRNLNTEIPASRLTQKDEPSNIAAINAIVNSVYNGSVIIAFDAGYTVTEAEKNLKFLSYRSITPEQWDSYDLFVLAAIKAVPGVAHMSASYLMEFAGKNGANVRVGNAIAFGPGFNADKYALLKDKGVGEVDFVEKKTSFGGTIFEPITRGK